MFLRIRNDKAVDFRAFTILGLSNTRGTDGIGQFGSGTKHAINLLLRKNIRFRIYSKSEEGEFTTRDDEFEGKPFKRVVASINGFSEDTGWCLDFGAIDWQDTNMALREFVSNALDRSGVEGTSVSLVESIEPDDEGTSIYIEATEEVKAFFDNLNRHFLQFNEFTRDAKFVESAEKCGVYRRGVLIRELGKSLFDYNLDIQIDECRNSNEYTVKAEIAKALSNAPKDILVRLFQNGDSTVLEAKLDTYYLSSGQYSGEATANWKAAFEEVYGDLVPCRAEYEIEKLSIRGLKGIVVLGNLYDAMGAMGIRTSSQFLSAADYCETLEPGKDDMKRFHECLKILKCDNPPSIRRTKESETCLQGNTIMVGCKSKARMLVAIANYMTDGKSAELLANRLLKAMRLECVSI